MHNKAAIFVCFLGLFAIACAPAAASINIMIDPKVGNTVRFSGHGSQVFYYGGNGYYGGPFAGLLNGSTTWNTFCVECDGGSETIVLDTNYKVGSLSPNTAAATGNFISDEAKWIYWQYGHGLLTEVTGWTVNDLQLAIWHGVYTGQSGQPLTMYTNQACTNKAYENSPKAIALFELAEEALLGDDPLAKTKADSIWVLNPVIISSGVNVQSMLYEVVPEPAGLLVWFALGGVAAAFALVKRRYTKQ